MPFPRVDFPQVMPACAVLLAALLGASVQAQPSSGKAALRFRCEGGNVGAAVHINGQFKGECPFDVGVPEGTLKIRAVQQIGQEYERVFEQDVRVAADSVKVIEVDMGPKRLTAEGRRLVDARNAERAAALARQRAAAEGGDAQAMWAMAKTYEQGQDGLPQDQVQASAWYSKAAEAGNAEAMYHLAERDKPVNTAWLRKAAQAGHAKAQAWLNQLPRYCQAEAVKGGLFEAMVISPGFEDMKADGTAKPITAALKRYARQLKRLQPGAWDDVIDQSELRCYRIENDNFFGNALQCKFSPGMRYVKLTCGSEGDEELRRQEKQARENDGKFNDWTMILDWRGE